MEEHIIPFILICNGRTNLNIGMKLPLQDGAVIYVTFMEVIHEELSL